MLSHGVLGENNPIQLRLPDMKPRLLAFGAFAFAMLLALRDLITGDGSQVAGGTPEAFGAFIRSETGKWGKVVRTANISAQ